MVTSGLQWQCWAVGRREWPLQSHVAYKAKGHYLFSDKKNVCQPLVYKSLLNRGYVFHIVLTADDSLYT